MGIGVPDAATLATWLEGFGLAGGEIQDLRPLSGGTQNVMARFTRDGQGFVVRQPPAQPRPSSERALLREARVLRALGATDVPHPQLVAASDQQPFPDGTVTIVMEEIDGASPAELDARAYLADPQAQARLGPAAVDALLALHLLSPRELELTDLGRPDGFIERQVPRWLEELATHTAALDGQDPLPRARSIAAWLSQHEPAQARTGLLHGDPHLGNMLYHRDGSAVAALIDWEMATIGATLLDLGWLLATWPFATSPSPLLAHLTQLHDLSPPGALVSQYQASIPAPDGQVVWFTVLACFKLAIVLEGTHVRARLGAADPAVGDALHDAADALLRRGQAITVDGIDGIGTETA